MTHFQSTPISTLERNPAPFEPLPPHSTEAEECVLGSCLIDPVAFLLAAQILRAADFFHPRHRIIVEAMTHLTMRDEPTDFVLVSDELERMGALDRVGGEITLARLLTVVPTAAHVEHYARVVRRTAVSRALISAAGRIAARAYGDGEACDAIAFAAAEVERIRSTYECPAPTKAEQPIWTRYHA